MKSNIEIADIVIGVLAALGVVVLIVVFVVVFKKVLFNK